MVRCSVHTFSVAGPAARPAALLVLRDERGLSGVGEAAPLPGFSSETLDEAVQALHAFCPPASIDETRPPLEAVARVLEPYAPLLATAPTARFALETALLDLLAQRRGVDVATCLRLSLSGDSPSREGAVSSIEASALILSASDPEALVEVARAAIVRGFRTIKVKLRATDDASLEREVESLLALRRAAPDVALRLDPNGRWTIAEARRYLDRLACVAPEFVEQPVPAPDLADLGPCAVPWAADESLGIPTIAARLRRESGCAAFVLKPAALGIAGALEAARTARERGLGVVVTHFMDGPVGLAAACEVALALDPPPLPCGLDPHAGLAALGPELLPHHDGPACIAPRSRRVLQRRVAGPTILGDGDGDGNGNGNGDGNGDGDGNGNGNGDGNADGNGTVPLVPCGRRSGFGLGLSDEVLAALLASSSPGGGR